MEKAPQTVTGSFGITLFSGRQTRKKFTYDIDTITIDKSSLANRVTATSSVDTLSAIKEVAAKAVEYGYKQCNEKSKDVVGLIDKPGKIIIELDLNYS